MNLTEIMEKCSGLEVCEQRSDQQDYKELVFLTGDLSRWQSVLESVLGPAVKPPGVEPSNEHLESTANYGGIHKSQTLFERKNDNGTVIAMFWPWGDSEHVTLKMALSK